MKFKAKNPGPRLLPSIKMEALRLATFELQNQDFKSASGFGSRKQNLGAYNL